ncbi:MAG: copper resistance protein, partial [Pseudomonadota bacterium]
CITCKANKTLVLERGEVAERLTDGSIKTMQADWTRPNDAIADYLARHNRYGIPFDVVYGPNAPDGIVLPELLTPDAVLNAIKDAGA